MTASLPARIAGRVAPLANRVAPLANRIGPFLGWLGMRASAGLAAARRRWHQRPGARARALRRRAGEPLPILYAVHPDARLATPREVGLRSVDIDEIAGTAVAGPAQRGADFLPLKPFRSRNWSSRWQRILRAIDNLAILPPVDVVRYGGTYWVLDGHNRVAAAHYVGQVEIDANVTELVPPGENPSERPANLAAALTGTTALRAAGQGGRLRTMRDDEVPGPRPGEPGGTPATARPTAPAELVAPAAEPAAASEANEAPPDASATAAEPLPSAAVESPAEASTTAAEAPPPVAPEPAAAEAPPPVAPEPAPSAEAPVQSSTTAAEPPPGDGAEASDEPPEPEARHATGAPPAMS